MTFGPETRLGLVGLGIMGAPLARRLRSRGYALSVWNLEPERFDDVEASGAVWKDSPAQVWAASDVTFICVLGDHAVQSCALGEDGFATADPHATLLVDLSTTSPAATLDMAARLKEQTGADWIDAPMSGGPAAAEDGSLTLMIGGSQDDCAAATELLDAIAGNVTRMGALGAGQKTKILNQAIVGVNYVLMAELLAIAKAGNVDPSRLPGCLEGGMADSTILQRIFSQMAAEDFSPPRSTAKQLAKDLRAVRAFVDDLGLDLPVLAQAISLYDGWAQDGNQDADGAAVSRLYR